MEPRDRQRQCDVFGQRQVVDELAVLMNDPDAPAHGGRLVAAHGGNVLSEDLDAARCGQKFAVAELDERGLA